MRRSATWRELGNVSAQRLLGCYRIWTPPIPVHQIALDVRIGVWAEESPDRPWAGYWIAGEEHAGVWLHKRLGGDERRSVLALMVAHVLQSSVPDRGAVELSDVAGETAVARWARDLVMPRWLLDPLLARTLNVDRIAYLFGVTMPVARARLQSILGWPHR